MKSSDIKLEIPGAEDILFCKDILLDYDTQKGIYTNPGGKSGAIVLYYYVCLGDDLGWILDWIYFNEYVSKRHLSASDMSEVSNRYYRRKVKAIMKDGCTFTFYNCRPAALDHDEDLSHNYVKFTIIFDYCTQEFI